MIFAVSSFNSVGCTFLDWSIHYLSGQDYFYSIKQKNWIPLSQQPLAKTNSHGHPKNHPRGYAATKKCVEQLLDHSGIVSIYPTKLSLLEAAQDLRIEFTTSITKDNLIAIQNYIKLDFSKMLNFIIDSGVNLIYIDTNDDVNLYFATQRSTESTITKIPDGKTSYDLNTIQTDFQDFFFDQSIQQWDNQGLTDIWDKRERMALNARPFDSKTYRIGFESKHLWVDSKTLWTDTERVLIKTLDFLDLKVNESRIDSWKTIQKNWSAIQLDALEFNTNYQRIIDSIVNNWWMEIDLTFEQEVIIQHCLIYQHNLNLKTWQLEKFPNNTQDLHKLLETNIHSVESIY